MRARMPASALAAAILLVLAPPVAAQVEPVCLPDIEAKTGPPEFNEGFTPLRLRARADYERETSGQRGAALTRVPDDLSAGVRFGRISNCKEIWIVAVDGEGPRHTVIVDVNRNGDLTDDPRKTLEPTRGLFEGFEFHTAVFEGPERRFRISVAGSGPMSPGGKRNLKIGDAEAIAAATGVGDWDPLVFAGPRDVRAGGESQSIPLVGMSERAERVRLVHAAEVRDALHRPGSDDFRTIPSLSAAPYMAPPGRRRVVRE